MHRDGEPDYAVGFPIDVMTAVDAKKKPAVALGNSNQFFTGNRLHTAISRTRSVGNDSVWATSTDKHPSMASCKLASNSSHVSPCVAQPGRAGTSAQYPPSSASCTTTLTFILDLPTSSRVKALLGVCSNPHGHDDIAVLEAVVAGVVGTHLAGGLRVFELQPNFAAVGGLEEIQ